MHNIIVRMRYHCVGDVIAYMFLLHNIKTAKDVSYVIHTPNLRKLMKSFDSSS